MEYIELEQQALQLPILQQVSLIRKLSISLNELSDEEYEQAVLQEVARRAQEIEEGKATLIPMEEVFAEIRQRLKNEST
jgi:putative addiction module component (TIGR02574 family)